MSYTAPTVDDFLARYAAFASTSSFDIEYWLADAASECTHWPDDPRANAEMALAAHKMVEVGVLKDLPAQGVSAFSSGDFSIGYGEASNRTGLDATVYGREFKRMTRAFLGGPRLAW